MITADNVKFCFENLNEEEVKRTMDSSCDYVSFQLSIFNVGGVSSCDPYDYDEELEQELTDNGNMFCDKDDFLRLYQESEAVNPHLEKYI